MVLRPGDEGLPRMPAAQKGEMVMLAIAVVGAKEPIRQWFRMVGFSAVRKDAASLETSSTRGSLRFIAVSDRIQTVGMTYAGMIELWGADPDVVDAVIASIRPVKDWESE
jgi:hypothetical protein